MAGFPFSMTRTCGESCSLCRRVFSSLAMPYSLCSAQVDCSRGMKCRRRQKTTTGRSGGFVSMEEAFGKSVIFTRIVLSPILATSTDTVETADIADAVKSRS